MRQKTLVYIGVAFLVCGIVFIGYGASINHYYQSRAWAIESVVTRFIVEHEGRFPKSQQELIDEEYLKIDSQTGTARYFSKVEINNKMEWREWPVELHRFTIAYGARKEDLHVMDNKLYRKNSEEEVYLFDGPFNRSMEPSLRRSYRLISLKWYEQMK